MSEYIKYSLKGVATELIDKYDVDKKQNIILLIKKWIGFNCYEKEWNN